MMKGKSKSERKCISSELATTGVAVLLAPDPKAQCHTDVQQIAGGRYGQALTCPQKQGPPISITRTGTYNASGFAGRLDMGGQTPKGAMRITLDQKATHGAVGVRPNRLPDTGKATRSREMKSLESRRFYREEETDHG
jgi:hypothetical protein